MNATETYGICRAASSEMVCADSRFSCNICLDPVEEPVVTQCGHLYCWPCLFRWLEPGMTSQERQSLQLPGILEQPPDPARRVCPVCKASCGVAHLIPIYVRSATTTNSTNNANKVTEPHSAAASKKGVLEHSPLSDIDDKNSISSTIATEQEQEEEDESDEVHRAELETFLRSGGGGQEEEEMASQNQAVLSIPLEDSSHHQQAAPPASALGALRRASASSPLNDFPSTLLVPARPSSIRPRAFSENAVGILQQQQEHPNLSTNMTRTLALSQGLALTLHRALQPTASTASTARAAALAAASVVVPPLHRAEGFGNAAAVRSQQQQTQLEQDPNATEFLSRILLMLASFVILCLLLF